MVIQCLRTAVLVFSLLLICLLELVSGHGRLLDPPSRSSMWREGFSNPANYDDNQLFCGGVQVQYEQNGGRCGVCGDPWQGPRENEPGGKYANGIIVRSYRPGQNIKVVVELTANHKGYFEFKLCPNDDPKNVVTLECFNQYVLQVVKPDLGGTKFPVPNKNGYQKIELEVRLPQGIRCRDCVFQWKYNAGNNWGRDPVTGKGCIGCGNQEQFYGCADIAVGYDNIEEGFSLITNTIEKGPSNRKVITPPPVLPRDQDDGDMWESDNYGTTESIKITNSIELYRDFQEFRRRFRNSRIQPCVCQSCVGSTCVCECFISSGTFKSPTCFRLWSVLVIALLAFLLAYFRH